MGKFFARLGKGCLNSNPFGVLWARYRSRQVERRYMRWETSYRELASQRGIIYSVRSSRDLLLKRLESRAPVRRQDGDVYSLLMTITTNWGVALVEEMKTLGPTEVFDWERYGFSEAKPPSLSELVRINEIFFRFAAELHQRRPFDWILVTASGNVILKETLQRLKEELGVPVVQLWLDCKQNFSMGRGPAGQDLGQIDVAAGFDLVWTSSRSMCEAYLCEDALPVYLPPAFAPGVIPRIDCEKQWDVGFLAPCTV